MYELSWTAQRTNTVRLRTRYIFTRMELLGCYPKFNQLCGNKEINFHCIIQSRMFSEKRVVKKVVSCWQRKSFSKFPVNRNLSVVKTAHNMLPLIERNRNIVRKCEEQLNVLQISQHNMWCQSDSNYSNHCLFVFCFVFYL